MAWLMCGLGAVFYSYEYFLRISPSVMESALREHFDLTATGFGLLSSFYYYAYVPMQIPVGIMMDRYGPRKLLTFACVSCVVGTLIFSMTPYFWVAAFGRFLVGFGSAFAFVGVLKLATLWLPEDKLAMVSGLAAALGTVGAMIGDNILGELVTRVGWQDTVKMTAIAGVILSVILWLGIRDRKSGAEHGTIDNFRQSMIDLRIIASNRQIWINGMYGCLVYLPTTVFAELWGIPYLTHAQNLSQKSADFANSMIFLGFTLGAPLMGFISDKLRRRKLPMMVGAGGAALLMIIILYVPGLDETRLRALMFLLGMFYSSQAIVFAVGRELSPKEAAGTAMAMTNMIVMLGATILQPLIGRLLDWSVALRNPDLHLNGLTPDKLHNYYTLVDYQRALIVIPFGIIIALILTFFLKETHAKA
ncbi:MAG: MFS transporter [Legionellaceae bacterium]|nr:MFS transporter [Legionellaceae bacterium]